jgi:hypothetical protein
MFRSGVTDSDGSAEAMTGGMPRAASATAALTSSKKVRAMLFFDTAGAQDGAPRGSVT